MIDFYMHLTDAAIESFNRKIAARNTPNVHIRVGVRGGGCSGYTYVIQFEDDAPREKDLKLFYNGIRVLVDPKSATYLNGCVLDWEQTLVASGFKFTNPKASSCGCGSSFFIK